MNINDTNPTGLVPFHKLTQWLCYSLIEPLAMCGLEVTEVEALTGLLEYRNGGLFVDLGVLEPKNRKKPQFNQAYSVDSEFVVEWRALTIALLDQVAQTMQLPLVVVLQKTWVAGRKLAWERRSDGSPPFQLIIEGAIF